MTCPHCRKRFHGEPLLDDAGRPGGFKCAHCRLFVPFERAVEQDLLEPTD